MRSHVGPIALLVAVLCTAGCGNPEPGLQERVQADVADNLANRDDIPESDKGAAATAIATDVAALERESAVIGSELGEHDARLQRELPSRAELAAQDCDQRRQELEALQRLAQDPSALDPGQQAALPEEIKRAQAGLAERCGS